MIDRDRELEIETEIGRKRQRMKNENIHVGSHLTPKKRPFTASSCPSLCQNDTRQFLMKVKKVNQSDSVPE